MTTETLGTLMDDGTQRAVRFERHYDAPPEQVWEVLVDPAHVRRWLAEMTIEPRVGGGVAFDWGSTNQDEGVVQAFEPPRLFEYTWSREGPSVIRFELSQDGDGTLLVLEHTNLSAEQAISVGAGWHSHLDAMEALLAGSPQTASEWSARYESLRPVYEGKAAALG